MDEKKSTSKEEEIYIYKGEVARAGIFHEYGRLALEKRVPPTLTAVARKTKVFGMWHHRIVVTQGVTQMARTLVESGPRGAGARLMVEALRQGNHLEVAAALGGLSREDVYKWMKRGLAEPEGDYGQFAKDVKAAMAEAEVRSVQVIAEAAERDWKAAAWMLERRAPNRWGRPSQESVDLTAERQRMLERLQGSLTEQEYLKVLEVMAGPKELGSGDGGKR